MNTLTDMYPVIKNNPSIPPAHVQLFVHQTRVENMNTPMGLKRCSDNGKEEQYSYEVGLCKIQPLIMVYIPTK